MESFNDRRGDRGKSWDPIKMESGGLMHKWRRQEIRKSVWAEDEHERFVAALKQYGRDWKAIESSVGTRTAVQIRSHAQKYFIKLKRHNSTEFNALPPPRKKRTREKAGSTTSSSTIESPALTPVSTPPCHEQEISVYSNLTARDYACADALSLLVCAADRMDRLQVHRPQHYL
eukprot:Plantae.Rhodophyta-Purpureofilum_apyrenoidigerum.ctg21194.p1 GENE.Plantae.Rhodophyta-Purpureofilum_apyrenoidigerum.ctg21194~~Plantae.Rhodophyta-Purpureofilum_apyrenoidigerum.ctg21194.p1  ORF type:complete len:174 (+),score=27.71 Plantae.Rhodophyta-Purpureofilum_apyrenoidigerum.ctg21194:123-644(+)